MFVKLYKRGDCWVAVQEGRFVVVSDWMGQERVVFTSTSSPLEGDRQEAECVAYCQAV